MTATPAHIRPRHDLTSIEIDRLEQRLYDHNRRATGRHDGKEPAFVAVDEHGTQTGAIGLPVTRTSCCAGNLTIRAAE